MTRIIKARRGGTLGIQRETADRETEVLRALRVQLRDSAALAMGAPADAAPMAFKHPKYAEPPRVRPDHLPDGSYTGLDISVLSETFLRPALGVGLHGKAQLVPQHHCFPEHLEADAGR